MTPNPTDPHNPDPWPQQPAADAGQVGPQSPAGHPYSPSPYPPPMYAPLVRPTSGMATASLIFGIVGVLLFCTVIPSLVAVLCGHSAVKATRTGQLGGHGQAVAGLILGYAVMIPAVIWLVFGGIGTIMEATQR